MRAIPVNSLQHEWLYASILVWRRSEWVYVYVVYSTKWGNHSHISYKFANINW
jgi:hypothetical protein